MPKPDKRHEERRGLGKVVYSVDSEAEQETRREIADATEEVNEASKDSFPASDPPEFTGITAESTEQRPK